MAGEVLSVANGDSLRHVDFWFRHDDDQPQEWRWFQVVGTGHRLPDDARYAGTCLRTPEKIVWHLCERTSLAGRPRKEGETALAGGCHAGARRR